MSYVYYSYEEWGRGYIGSRSRDAEGDDEYFGSFYDKMFRPTHKIVLAEFDDPKDALQAEIELHAFYDVARNPHFANRCRATTTCFSVAGTKRSAESNRRIADAWTDERREDMGARLRQKFEDPEFAERYSQLSAKARRSNWRREVWEEVERRLEQAQGHPWWGQGEVAKTFGVGSSTLKCMRRLILKGVTFDEATG